MKISSAAAPVHYLFSSLPYISSPVFAPPLPVLKRGPTKKENNNLPSFTFLFGHFPNYILDNANGTEEE